MKYFAWKLLAINIIVFILELTSPYIIPLFALNPAHIIQTPWTLITAMFLHATTTILPDGATVINLNHLLQNMVALGLFGILLEKIIDSKEFLILYLTAGIFGNLAGIIFYPDSISLGASGAIMGILGALTILRPKMVVFLGGPIPLILLSGMWILIDLAGFFAPVDNTGHAAHLAGFAAGIIYGILNKNRFREDKEIKEKIEDELSDEEMDAWENEYMKII
ncbi:MAG: rhomboid family intramembrane serine protease [archaeon]|nr:rhomboid family intramembrane serine protease [archaeon]